MRFDSRKNIALKVEDREPESMTRPLRGSRNAQVQVKPNSCNPVMDTLGVRVGECSFWVTRILSKIFLASPWKRQQLRPVDYFHK